MQMAVVKLVFLHLIAETYLEVYQGPPREQFHRS